MTQHIVRQRKVAALAMLMLIGSGCAAVPEPIADSAPIWRVDFEHAVEFQELVRDNLLIVGTTRHLYGLDPRTGRQIWRERNVNPGRGDILVSADGAQLYIADAAGGAFEDDNTHMLALASSSGALLWESARISGKVLQSELSADGTLLFLTIVELPHGDDRGLLSGALTGKGIGAGFFREPSLLALSTADGKLQWQVSTEAEVRLRPAALSGSDSERRFDLAGFHPPQILPKQLCSSFSGLQCFDPQTGRRLWRAEFPVMADGLALAYARPVVVNGVAYLASSDRVKALYMHSGTDRWRSEKVDVVSELSVGEQRIYARLGGRFFDLAKEAYRWRGDFGAMMLDPLSGATVWRYSRGSGSVTNLHIDENLVWFADRKRLIGLDRETGESIIRVKHGLTRSPEFLFTNAQDQLVLTSEDEVAAFDRAGTSLWLIRHPAPQPGALKRMSAQLYRLSGSMLQLASTAIAVSSGLIPSVPALPISGGTALKLISSKRVARGATRAAGAQMQENASQILTADGFSVLAGSYQYFLTARPGDERVLLASVDINSGQTVGLVPLPFASSKIVIDDTSGRLFHAEGTAVLAVQFR